MVVWWPANRTTVIEYCCLNPDDFQQAAFRTISNIILLMPIVKWHFNNFSNANFFQTAVSFNFAFDRLWLQEWRSTWQGRKRTCIYLRVIGPLEKWWGGGGRGRGNGKKLKQKKFLQEIINKKYIRTDSGQKNICPRRGKNSCCISQNLPPPPPPPHFSNGPSVTMAEVGHCIIIFIFRYI